MVFKAKDGPITLIQESLDGLHVHFPDAMAGTRAKLRRVRAHNR